MALFKKFCKRDFCDEVRDFKIPEPEAVSLLRIFCKEGLSVIE